MCSSQPQVCDASCHPLVAVDFCLHSGVDLQGYFGQVLPSVWTSFLTCKTWGFSQHTAFIVNVKVAKLSGCVFYSNEKDTGLACKPRGTRALRSR